MRSQTTGSHSLQARGNTFIYHGNLIGVNKWHGARVIKRGGKLVSMIYENKVFKDFKRDFGVQAARSLKKFPGYVHFAMHVWMWKMKDTDGILKAIFDSLEQFNIIKDDNMIVNVSVTRHYNKKSEQDMAIIELQELSEIELKIIKAEMESGYNIIGENNASKEC